MDAETLHRKLREFEQAWNYDAAYQHELIDAAPQAAATFAQIPLMVNRKAAPEAALAAAGLATLICEDCEPCAQLAIHMGLASGVSAAVLRAIVAGDEAAMGDEAALAWRFARAVLAADEPRIAPLRAEIVRRWGKPGLAAVALAVMTSRTYPTLKYALGFGQPIRSLEVSGTAVAPGGRAPVPA